jgi:H+/gluconate symporter-like permease
MRRRTVSDRTPRVARDGSGRFLEYIRSMEFQEELKMLEALGLPAIIGMLPLVVYIVMALMGKSQIALLVVSTALAMILSGTGIIPYAGILAKAMGSSLTLIGLVILTSSALGKVLEQSGVSRTLVYGIVRCISVKTEKRAILVTMICSTLICGILGTLGGGNAILAPILIPMVAAVGLSRSTVGAIFQNAGETGLIWGPLSPPVVALLSMTKLSYGRMMLTAAFPYGLVWLVTSYFAIKRIQEKTRTVTPYTDVTYTAEFVPVKKDIFLAALFIACFLGFIAYSIGAKQGIPFLVFVMMALTVIVGLASGRKPDDLFKTAIGGMASGLPLFVVFLLFGPMFDMMTDMGAFDALANVFGGLVNLVGGTGLVSRAMTVILASFVGGFGVEGAAVVQMQITNTLFSSILTEVKIPMELWALALIAASRITSVIYPAGNMIGQMGLARSDDVKAMLKVGWTVAGVMMVFIVVYAFVGAAFMY